MFKNTIFFISAFLLVLSSCMSVSDKTVESYSMSNQDSDISAMLSTDSTGSLVYTLTFQNKPLLEKSQLGITVDGIELGSGVAIGQPKIKKVAEEYQTRGNDRVATNKYIQWAFPIRHIETARDYLLEFRLYQDGIAYRYKVSAKDKSIRQHITKEASEWKLSEDMDAWFFERNSHWKLMSYAGVWTKTKASKLHSVSSQGPIQGAPIVLELPTKAGFAVITKAATYNYSGMRLLAKDNLSLQANFTEGNDGFHVEGDVVTPWRVTQLASDLNTLVNSDLIENLNPAPDAELFKDTSYIKPGRSVWRWLSLGLDTPEDELHFVKKAQELGFEYNIIDDGWKDWSNPWQQIKRITDDASKRGVGVFVWVDSKDIKQPNNDYQQLKDYLDLVKFNGAVGVKTDFMNSESKQIIDFEIALLREAAKRQLLVNFHGNHAGTGESRTYPNEITREGIRGIEVNNHNKGHLSPRHNTALPFTRFLVGQADYTPIYYTNPGPTTWAHQLATVVVFYSPLQVYADHPEFLQNHPIARRGLDMLMSIPTVWDETKVLAGSEIGELAAFARRSKNTWFIGILNGESQQDFPLDLSFLPPGVFDMAIVKDDIGSPLIDLNGLNKKAKLRGVETALGFTNEHKTVTSKDNLTIPLISGGGYVARFTLKVP